MQWYAERICSTVNLANVVPVAIPINATMTVRATKLTNSEINAAITAALSAASRAVPIGGFDLSPNNAVPVEYCEGALRGPLAGRATVVTVAVTLPAADVVFAAGEVAVMSLGTLTITRIP